MRIIPKTTPKLTETPETHFRSINLNGESVLPILYGFSRFTSDSDDTTVAYARPEASLSGRIWIKEIISKNPADTIENQAWLLVDSSFGIETMDGAFSVFPTDSDKWVILGLSGGVNEIIFFDPATEASYLYNRASYSLCALEDLNAYDRLLTGERIKGHPVPDWDHVARKYKFAESAFTPIVDYLETKKLTPKVVSGPAPEASPFA
ncbi:hypothetical protein IJ380_03495 [Candidatus Saccharibacteria bacterium]|nr:hypothetical protein [Candidatus Saccharibacteria bacterium]